LETYGVTVVGMGTDEFPAFYSHQSGLRVDVRCDSAADVAAIWRAKRELELPSGLLVTVPIPAEAEIPAAEIEPTIAQATNEAAERRLRSAEVTPFLLTRIAELTGTRSLQANLALLKNNARVAAQIAIALAA
jgi:pseudouridylate synthase